MIDVRKNKGKKYTVKDLIFSALVMFYFKEGSRNAYNADIEQAYFKRNIQNALKFKLVHGDTFDDFFRKLDTDCLEKLKTSIIKTIIQSKTLDHGKLNNKFVVAVDGTKTGIYGENNADCALKKESKNGVISYSRAVLEAKLVAESGFCISLGSVWIENIDNHNKQDCEQNAFKRLATQIKIDYPDLPIILVLDALFASDPVISICKQNNWDFFIVQKNNFSKFLIEEIDLNPGKKTVKIKTKTFKFLNNVEYTKDKNVNWFSLHDKSEQYQSSWISNLEIKKELLLVFEKIARLRWKIENEGFNIQKNNGYELEHKYSRGNLNAIKNYYQCIQITAIIDQLIYLDIKIKKILKKITKKKVIEWCKGILINILFDSKKMDILSNEKIDFCFVE